MFVGLTLSLSGCGIGYLLQSADGQYKLIAKKVSFEKVLSNPDINDETKRKIKLVQEVKKFAENEYSLSPSKSYESFVQLDGKYVTYAVTASPQNKIQAYLWSFPIIGKVPYKGYFKKQGADDEAAELRKENYDVLVRGVSAYSTLGWFNDPLLSSMLNDSDADLVETIIHEMTHTTLYIKNSSEFNERLATFVGQKGLEDFYFKKEGIDSTTLKKAKAINSDRDVFFEFISKEIKNMDLFYEKAGTGFLKERDAQFAKIKDKFNTEILPKLKTKQYIYFSDLNLNNAVLLNYKIYYHNLKIFEKLFKSVDGNWKDFFKVLDEIKNSKTPEADLLLKLN